MLGACLFCVLHSGRVFPAAVLCESAWACSGHSTIIKTEQVAELLQASGPYPSGKAVLADILMPSSHTEFFQDIWEKRPMFISRPSLRQWYGNWLSENKIFELLASTSGPEILYGYNLDVTAYNGEVRPALLTCCVCQKRVCCFWRASVRSSNTGSDTAGETRLQLQQRRCCTACQSRCGCSEAALLKGQYPLSRLLDGVTYGG